MTIAFLAFSTCLLKPVACQNTVQDTLVRELMDLREEKEFGKILALSSSQLGRFNSAVDKLLLAATLAREEQSLESFRISELDLDPSESKIQKKRSYDKYRQKIALLNKEFIVKLDSVLVKEQWNRVRQLAYQRQLQTRHREDEFATFLSAAVNENIPKEELGRLKAKVPDIRKSHQLELSRTHVASANKATSWLTEGERLLAERMVGVLPGANKASSKPIPANALDFGYQEASSMRKLLMAPAFKQEAVKEVELSSSQWNALNKFAKEFNSQLILKKKEFLRENPLGKDPSKVTVDDVRHRKKVVQRLYDRYKEEESHRFSKSVEKVLLPNQLGLLKQRVTRISMQKSAGNDQLQFIVILHGEISDDSSRKKELADRIEKLKSDRDTKIEKLNKRVVNELMETLSLESRKKIKERIGELRFQMQD